MNGAIKDLVVLVPDNNLKFSIQGLLLRYQTLEIRPVTTDIFVHVRRDPGCLADAHNFLRPFLQHCDHALVILDRIGSGREYESRTEMENSIEEHLFANGWMDRAAAIVIDPELESWVWSTSPHVDSVLGWQGRTPDLRSWLKSEGMLAAGHSKPNRPKEAMESAMRTTRKPRSSAVYLELASRTSLKGCVGPAFQKLSAQLKSWYERKPE